MASMNEAERERLLDAACTALADALPQAWAVYVYGSFARGEERTDSDLDLAVLLPTGSTIPDKLSLMADVSDGALWNSVSRIFSPPIARAVR